MSIVAGPKTLPAQNPHLDLIFKGESPIGVSFDGSEPPIQFETMRGIRYSESPARAVPVSTPASATPARIDGSWECVTKTPMGDQKTVLTIQRDGKYLTGTNVGANGTMDLLDGEIDGNKITWRMELTSPFTMELDASATIDGDKLSVSVKAGAFGSSVITGTRVA